ncbi:Ger(x)C family spore germination protein [Halobacillus salinus]|uniref:Ger(X)C family spore germination protein n=1 Tax=Halobacillus salinus TaxID=192814 RepID=A0A4Z0H6G6_9BACI|nr:Ger(x)C family spore germination protein [Halobacillus salinus]TGB04971.1 Ger(x)C family spore germination protein [Halobacillus salinus]
MNISVYKWFARATVILTCLFLLTGCWNSKELDELGIAVATGIDKNDDGDYVVVVQVINPSEIATDAPTNRPPVSTYSITGKTIFEAFKKLSAKSPRKIYFSQMRLVVLGEKLTQEGIMPTLDFLYRDHEYRASFYVTVARDAPVDKLLSIVTPYEKIPANKIMNSIDNVQLNWGVTKGITIDKLIADIRSPGISPVLAGIYIIGNEDEGNNMSNVENVDAPTKLEIDHLVAFKDDKSVGWLNEEQSQGLNYATGDVKSTIVTHPCDDKGTLTVEILRTTSGIKANTKNSNPSATISIEAEGNVAEVDCEVDLGAPDAIHKINKEVEKQIEDLVQSTIKVSQEEFESDILGIGGAFHRDEPKYWKSVEGDWDQQYKNVEISVDAKVKVRRKGNSTQPIDKKG